MKQEKSSKSGQTKLLLPGDIVFELGLGNFNDSKAVPYHCWVYTGRPRSIAHSSIGTQVTGVTTHTFKKYFSENSDSLSMHYGVWRINNPELRNIFVRTVISSTPTYPAYQLDWVKKVESGNPEDIDLWNSRQILFSPYNGERRKDITMRVEKNQFRAVRAAIRTEEKTLAPLSKKKGISCNQFLLFSLQAALIKLALDIDIKQLKEGVTRISKTGIKYCEEKTLQNFSNVLKKLLMENQSNLPLDITIKNIIDFCSYSVKGNTIETDFKFVKSCPLLNFAGNLTIVGIKGENPQPYIIDKTLVKKVATGELPLLHTNFLEMITALEDNLTISAKGCCLIS